jgi:hypothetical protein
LRADFITGLEINLITDFGTDFWADLSANLRAYLEADLSANLRAYLEADCVADFTIDFGGDFEVALGLGRNGMNLSQFYIRLRGRFWDRLKYGAKWREYPNYVLIPDFMTDFNFLIALTTV